MKKFASALLGALLMLVSCTSEEVQGEISFKREPSIEFDGEGGTKTIKFQCGGQWHVDIPSDASWLSANPSSIPGSITAEYQEVELTAEPNDGKSSRSTTVAVVSGDNRHEFSVSQKPATIVLTEEEVKALGIDPARVSTDVMGSLKNLYRSDSEFWFGRAQVSPAGNIILFWDKGYDEAGEIKPGDEATDESIRVDVDNVLMKCDKYWDYYKDTMDMMVDYEESYLSKYYMVICLYGTTSWRAEGGGAGKMGAIWESATTCQPCGSTIAHELAHAFQYQVYADTKNVGGFMQCGYGWDTYANHMSYNLYAAQAYNSANFTVFVQNHMKHVISYDMLYATYWWPFTMQDKHGVDAIGRLWKESKSSEDFCKAYIRIFCGGDVATFNRDIYDYAAKCTTWDFDTHVYNFSEAMADVEKEGALREFGTDYIGKIGWTCEHGADGFNTVGDDEAPEATGFNHIRLNVPAEGGSVSAEFVGLATKNAGDAAWTCGYVALTADGVRHYSEPLLVKSSGTVSWSVPAGTEKLWMVVSATPDKYYSNDSGARYPFKVRFTGTDIFGTIDFTGDETPHDTEITKTATCSPDAGYSGPVVTLDEDDLEQIGRAFVMQPYDIAGKIAADRDDYKKGEVKFAAVQSDGSLSYNYTANGYGFWYNQQGDVVSWGNSQHHYCEYTVGSWTYQLGFYPGIAASGEEILYRTAFVYGDHKAVVNIKMKVE